MASILVPGRTIRLTKAYKRSFQRKTTFEGACCEGKCPFTEVTYRHLNSFLRLLHLRKWKTKRSLTQMTYPHKATQSSGELLVNVELAAMLQDYWTWSQYNRGQSHIQLYRWVCYIALYPCTSMADMAGYLSSGLPYPVRDHGES
jgi:hypothetical protein